MKRATILYSLILIPFLCFSQDRIREIKVKDDTFIHRQTGFAFPKEISGFDREAVYAFATNPLIRSFLTTIYYRNNWQTQHYSHTSQPP